MPWPLPEVIWGVQRAGIKLVVPGRGKVAARGLMGVGKDKDFLTGLEEPKWNSSTTTCAGQGCTFWEAWRPELRGDWEVQPVCEVTRRDRARSLAVQAKHPKPT